MPSLSPAAEARRIFELHGLGILDTPRERSFDHLVKRAAQALRVPVALISLVDRERQWFKARIGMEQTETPRDIAFCAHTILGRDPLVVEDAALDPRFSTNPLVTAKPGYRFYAGIPLVTSRGNAIGTLCAIGYEPRRVTPDELAQLSRIAGAVTGQIETRTAVRDINAEFARLDTLVRMPATRSVRAEPEPVN